MENKLGRIIAIDYGLKRVGIAVTDPLQIIATPLTTIAAPILFPFLKDYLEQENVVTFVMGMPNYLNGKPSTMGKIIKQIATQLKKLFQPKVFITKMNDLLLSWLYKDSTKLAILKRIEQIKAI